VLSKKIICSKCGSKLDITYWSWYWNGIIVILVISFLSVFVRFKYEYVKLLISLVISLIITAIIRFLILPLVKSSDNEIFINKIKQERKIGKIL